MILSTILFLFALHVGAQGTAELGANATGVFISTQLDPIPQLYDTIHKASVFSALAYFTKHDRISVGELKTACPCTLCSESPEDVFVEHVYRGTVSGVVFRNDQTREIVLALKGTTSTQEWVLDFKVWPIPYHPLNNRKKGWKRFFFFNRSCRGCTVHKGFYDGAKEVYDSLFDKVLASLEAYPGYTLLVTGHSLGGAVSALIAKEFVSLGVQTTLVTFGSPKIGNKHFASAMDEIWNTDSLYDDLTLTESSSSFMRVSHKHDVVPLLPFNQMGYRHFGVDIYFNTNQLPMSEDDIELNLFSTDPLPMNDSSLAVAQGKMVRLLDSHTLYIVKLNQCIES